MGVSWSAVWSIALFVMLTSTAAGAVTLTVDTQVPDVIFEPTLDLSGSASTDTERWLEDTDQDFRNGTVYDLDIEEGSLVLKPELAFEPMAGGGAVLVGGGPNAWDPYIIDTCVVKNEGTYYMFYTGGKAVGSWERYALREAFHVGLATSEDGLTWTKYAGNPILSSRVDDYDYTNILFPVVLVEDGKWHMWYAGNHGNLDTTYQDIDICYASSNDGKVWKKYSNNPVLRHGTPDDAWNGLDIRPTSVFREDGVLKMYFKATGIGHRSSLGLATSKDPWSWKLVKDSPLYTGDPDGWEDGVTNYGPVESYAGTYRMWTDADKGTWKVGWISSTDGIEWTDSGEPVLTPKANTFYENTVEFPRVIDEGDHYKVYATCTDGDRNRRVLCFNATMVVDEGHYYSQNLAPRHPSTLRGVDWAVMLPVDTRVDVHLRFMDDDWQWSDWHRLNGSFEPVGTGFHAVEYWVRLRSGKDWLRPSFDWMALDYSIDIERVEVQVDDGPWLPVKGEPGAWHVTVDLHEGEYDILVRATDYLGSEDVVRIPVRVDLVDPDGILVLEDGRWATATRDLNYTVKVLGDVEVAQMRISTVGDPIVVPWKTFLGGGVYKYRGPDGNVTVYCQLRKPLGRVGPVFNDSVVVDTTPPDGRLLIEGGRKYTNSTDVVLDIEWWDLTGVEAMRVSNSPDLSDAEWTEPAHELEWTLAGPMGGERSVFVQLRDAVGWTTVLEDRINLGDPPPWATFVINGDDEYTTTRDVQLSIDLWSEDPVEFDLSNEGEGWEGDWTVLDGHLTVPWTLSPGDDGPRKVLMRVRDSFDDQITVEDDIVLDSTPPEGHLVLVSNEGFVNSSSVEAALDVTDALSGVHRMRVANGPDGTWSPWQTVVDTFDWVLPGGEGQRDVLCEVRDRAGNVATLEAPVIVDTTPPEGTIVVEGGRPFTSNGTVDVVLDFSDDLSGLDLMRVYSDAVIDWTDWETYWETSNLDLGTEEGPRSVMVEVRDRAGNVGFANGTIVLDRTPPEISVSYVGHDGMVTGVNDLLVEVVDEWDPSPAVEWRLDGESWRDLDGSSITVDVSPGPHEVEVRAVDAAGNGSSSSLEDEAPTDYSVYTGWILLLLIVLIVLGYAAWRERRTYQERLRER
jgi:predicted GH43/DUF377 family glycosyl hydrolase